MKKNYILVLLFTFSLFGFSQVTLTYNTDNVVTGTNSVGCPGGDNIQAREFAMSDFGITEEFTINTGEFGVQSNGVDSDVTVNVYASDGSFPTSFPGALLGSEVVTVAPVAAPGTVMFAFTTPIVVPNTTTHIVVELSTPLGTDFFIAGTVEETASSWIASVQCGVANYVTTDSIGFPDAHYFITVTGEETLSLEQSALSKVSVSPNPTVDVVNIQLHPSNAIKSVEVYNITGQKVFTGTSNTIDMSSMSAGLYLMEIETQNGTETKRIVKQ